MTPSRPQRRFLAVLTCVVSLLLPQAGASADDRAPLLDGEPGSGPPAWSPDPPAGRNHQVVGRAEGALGPAGDRPRRRRPCLDAGLPSGRRRHLPVPPREPGDAAPLRPLGGARAREGRRRRPRRIVRRPARGRSLLPLRQRGGRLRLAPPGRPGRFPSLRPGHDAGRAPCARAGPGAPRAGRRRRGAPHARRDPDRDAEGLRHHAHRDEARPALQPRRREAGRAPAERRAHPRPRSPGRSTGRRPCPRTSSTASRGTPTWSCRPCLARCSAS